MNDSYPVEYIRGRGLRGFLIILILGVGIFGLADYVKSNNEIFSTDMRILKKDNIKPDEIIAVSFSSSVKPEIIESVLKIQPDSQFNLVWSENKKNLKIIPRKNWENGQVYKVEIKEGRNFLGINFSGESIFSTENIPKVISMSPARGEKNILIGIEDPIVINFDKNIENYDVKIIFNPIGEFSHQINEQNNSIRIMPIESLELGKKYNVYVEMKYKKLTSEKDFKRVFESYFETKQLEIKDWSSDSVVKLFQAKNYTNPQVKEGKYIDINLKSQVMVIFENGEPLDSYLISSGKAGMNTPQGSFQIYNKYPRPWSGKYSLYMPFWMAITSSGEYGIHELPEWPNGYKEGANHLGIPVSHGCVRLGIGAAERVYNWAEIGTPVIIHY